MPEPLIRFDDVSKRFGGKEVLKKINFSVRQGEILGVIGPSGAGKTTLLRTLIGFYTVDGGDIRYKDMSISDNIPFIRSIMGFSSQEPCIYDELTVEENLEYFGELHGMKEESLRKNSDWILKLVGLEDSRETPAEDLSGGMRDRLDLCCALIHNPEILIMDEPTTGLDPLLRKQMWDLIKKINSYGTTIIISSHLLEEIEHLCERVAMIHRGSLMVEGTPGQLKEMYSKNQEIQLETYPGRYDQIFQSLQQSGAEIAFHVNKEHKLIMYTPRAESVLHTTLHVLEKMNERLLDVDVNKPSLNEVFESFMNYYERNKTNSDDN